MARALCVWDEGLVWYLTFGSQAWRLAMENPTWPLWANELVAERAAGILGAKRSVGDEDFHSAAAVLVLLAKKGHFKEASNSFQRLLSVLDGRSKKLTERQRSIVQTLASVPDISKEVFEHLFTVTARGKSLGDYSMFSLLMSPHVTDQHWEIALKPEHHLSMYSLARMLEIEKRSIPPTVRDSVILSMRELRDPVTELSHTVASVMLTDLAVRQDPGLSCVMARVCIYSDLELLIGNSAYWETLSEPARAIVREKAAAAEGAKMREALARQEPVGIPEAPAPPPRALRR